MKRTEKCHTEENGAVKDSDEKIENPGKGGELEGRKTAILTHVV